MVRQDIADYKKIYEEPRGYNPKYWIYDNGLKLIKYNTLISPNTDVMEAISADILHFLNIEVAPVTLGYNSNSEQLEARNIKDPNCAIVDSFLSNSAEVTINLTQNQWTQSTSPDEQKNISRCFYKVFDIFQNLENIDERDLLKMKSSYIRIILGDCIIDNEDRKLKNIEVIYNENFRTYRLAPSFDNGFAFNAKNINQTEGKCFIGNQSFKANSIIKYIIKHYYTEVDDIVNNLDYLDKALPSILKEYQTEIEPEKQNFILYYIKNVNETIQSLINCNVKDKQK